MKEFVTYSNPPIVEAVLDIQVKLPKEITSKELESFYDIVKDVFPEKKENLVFEASFQINKEEIATKPIPSRLLGYMFKSDIEKKVVQAKLDGFAFNKLKPYQKWELFKNEAQGLWEKYYEIFKPEKINRIALRYINQIEIPMPIKSFNDYIRIVPDLPEGLPSSFSEYFLRLNVPKHEIGASAIIIQTFKKPNNSNLPFIFDIDVFKHVDYSTNSSEIWEAFEELREFKNELFRGIITPKTEELFK